MGIKELRKKILPTLRREGVEKAAIFGSFAKGRQTKKSDIDLLVKMQAGKTLFDLVGLKLTLEEKTKRPVDIVTYNSLDPKLRKEILKTEQVIYEKRS